MWTVNNNASKMLSLICPLTTSLPFFFTARSRLLPLGVLFPKAREQAIHNRVQTVPFQIVVLTKVHAPTFYTILICSFPPHLSRPPLRKRARFAPSYRRRWSHRALLRMSAEDIHHKQEDNGIALENLLNMENPDRTQRSWRYSQLNNN